MIATTLLFALVAPFTYASVVRPRGYVDMHCERLFPQEPCFKDYTRCVNWDIFDSKFAMSAEDVRMTQSRETIASNTTITAQLDSVTLPPEILTEAQRYLDLTFLHASGGRIMERVNPFPPNECCTLLPACWEYFKDLERLGITFSIDESPFQAKCCIMMWAVQCTGGKAGWHVPATFQKPPLCSNPPEFAEMGIPSR